MAPGHNGLTVPVVMFMFPKRNYNSRNNNTDDIKISLNITEIEIRYLSI